MNVESNIFVLKNKKEEGSGVFTLGFAATKGRGFSFKAGQFATFQILKGNFLSKPGKSYTITSLSGEELLTIAVKKMGEFSKALCNLEIGDTVKVTGPFGNFYPVELGEKGIIFLAGGIGITPFYAVIKDFYKRRINKEIVLFYSNRERPDIVFLKEFEELLGKWGNLKIIYALTREIQRYSDIKEYQRLDVGIIKNCLGDLGGKDYFICGPANFVSDMKNQLSNAGVEQGSIKVEAFY